MEFSVLDEEERGTIRTNSGGGSTTSSLYADQPRPQYLSGESAGMVLGS